MHTERYCDTLDNLDRVKAIRAIRQAHLQLAASRDAAQAEVFDNDGALAALAECLRDAGHWGFERAPA